MNKKILILALAAVTIIGGCDQKQQDDAIAQGRVAVNKAGDAVGKAWTATVDEANKLTDGSASRELEAAKSSLESMRDKMSKIKAPTSLDDLKLDSVKEEIGRLQAALTVQNLKADMDARVKDAMQAKENAEKSFDDVKAKLQQADSQYRGLQEKLNQAQKMYDSASDKVKEISDKVRQSM